MSSTNRQRRAAKQRRRTVNRRRRAGTSGPSTVDDDCRADREELSRQATQRMRFVLASIGAVPEAIHDQARDLIDEDDAGILRAALLVLLETATRNLTQRGWTPADLGAITRRRLTLAHIALMVTLLTGEVQRHPRDRVATAWIGELADLGPGRRFELTTVDGLRSALELGALLAILPRIASVLPPPGTGDTRSTTRLGASRQHLSRVRALLAKAEATAYPDEAEALSAKAQELITRYALEHLLDTPDADESDKGVRARRLWIDAPYVMPKAMLIAAIAEANRCRAVVSEKLGVSTILGGDEDLAAVELLATSLMVQADRAVLSHGSQSTHWGTTRTTSFRRSFLLSYAQRIGERLTEASESALAETGRAGQLLPVLRGHAERVEAMQHELFPEMVLRSPSVPDAQGWALGRAAADQAQLDVRRAMTR